MKLWKKFRRFFKVALAPYHPPQSVYAIFLAFIILSVRRVCIFRLLKMYIFFLQFIHEFSIRPLFKSIYSINVNSKGPVFAAAMGLLVVLGSSTNSASCSQRHKVVCFKVFVSLMIAPGAIIRRCFMSGRDTFHL